MTYLEWCDALERRFDTMPPWYWIAAERRRRYDAEQEWRAARCAEAQTILSDPANHSASLCDMAARTIASAAG